METIFKIKWENIIALLLLAATIYVWVFYFKVDTDVKMLVLAAYTTFMFLVVMFGYKSISQFRKQVLKLW